MPSCCCCLRHKSFAIFLLEPPSGTYHSLRKPSLCLYKSSQYSKGSNIYIVKNGTKRVKQERDRHRQARNRCQTSRFTPNYRFTTPSSALIDIESRGFSKVRINTFLRNKQQQQLSFLFPRLLYVFFLFFFFGRGPKDFNCVRYSKYKNNFNIYYSYVKHGRMKNFKEIFDYDFGSREALIANTLTERQKGMSWL